jgi:hypothetical protein
MAVNRYSHPVYGMKGTPTYQSWESMKRRCKDPKKKYVQRGIKVCERWESFLNFLADMGIRPEGTTLERQNNDKGYAPGNCIWATMKEQSRNKTSNVFLTFDNETLCTADWARKTGISHKVIRERVNRGWSVEDALTIKPVVGANSHGC